MNQNYENVNKILNVYKTYTITSIAVNQYEI